MKRCRRNHDRGRKSAVARILKMLNQKQQFFEQIKKAQDILITFRKTWNGDSVSSALALYLFLKKLGKKVEIAAEQFKQGEAFSFLPAHNEIKYSIDNLHKFIISLDIADRKINQIKYRIDENTLKFIITVRDGKFTQEDINTNIHDYKYDLIFVLDTSDLESLGKIYEENTELFYKLPIVNIDHHSGNEEFGQINLINLTAVATSEIVFSLLKDYSPDALDEDIATCLLTGMISKTRSFKTPNITPQSLSVAAQLISMGARREEINNNLYRSRALNTLKLWGRILSRLSSSFEQKFVWSRITHYDFVETGTNESNVDDIVDELIINMPQVKVIALFYEGLNGGPVTKAMIHAIKGLDALELTKEFNPSGTKNTAQFTLNESIQEAEKRVVNAIEEKLKKISL